MFDYTHIISDTHFGHVKILEYEPMRQEWGKTTEEMTQSMIDAWRKTVGPDDHVLHLGDFMLGPKIMWPHYRKQLTGHITLVRGNHDPRKVEHWALLGNMNVTSRLAFDHPKHGIIVCRHDPHDFTQEDFEMANYLLHGHLHSGKHREDTPENIKSKAHCVSIERLPSKPGPMPFEAYMESISHEQVLPVLLG